MSTDDVADQLGAIATAIDRLAHAIETLPLLVEVQTPHPHHVADQLERSLESQTRYRRPVIVVDDSDQR